MYNTRHATWGKDYGNNLLSKCNAILKWTCIALWVTVVSFFCFIRTLTYFWPAEQQKGKQFIYSWGAIRFQCSVSRIVLAEGHTHLPNISVKIGIRILSYNQLNVFTLFSIFFCLFLSIWPTRPNFTFYAVTQFGYFPSYTVLCTGKTCTVCDFNHVLLSHIADCCCPHIRSDIAAVS